MKRVAGKVGEYMCGGCGARKYAKPLIAAKQLQIFNKVEINYFCSLREKGKRQLGGGCTHGE